MSVQPASRRSVVAVRLLVVSSIVLLATIASSAMPGSPGAGPTTSVPSTRLKPKPHDDQGGLTGETRVALSSLLSRLKSGETFSAEEEDVLVRYGGGEEINDIEAQTVISRALFEYYIKASELSPEHEKLLATYLAFIAPRKIHVDDRRARIAEQERRDPAPSPEAAPPNDICANAVVIPGAGPFPHLTTLTPNITDATTVGDPSPLPGSPCTTATALSRSTWYTFTPSVTSGYTISSCSNAPTGTTVADTVMAIYTSTGGCNGPFTQIAGGCDDDGCTTGDLQAVISATLTGGTQYYVVVWKFSSTAPAAGATAVQLRVTRNGAPPNDDCSAPINLPLDVTVLGEINASTQNDYQLSGTACFGGTAVPGVGRELVYVFTAPSNGQYTFSLSPVSGFDPLLYVTMGAGACPTTPPGLKTLNCDAGGPVLAASNRGSNTANASEIVECLTVVMGQQVFVFVDQVAAANGTFGLRVTRCGFSSEFEPNNGIGQAVSLTCGIQGSILSAGDVDFFEATGVVAGSRMFAMVDGSASGTPGTAVSRDDFQLRVIETTNTLEFDDDDLTTPFGANGFAPVVAGTPLVAGSNFLRINHFSATALAGPYRLYSVIQPPGAGLGGSSATAEIEANGTIATANAATNNFFSGTISAVGDTDFFCFNANAGDVVFLGLDTDPLRNNTPFNGALALLDSDGIVLLSVDDTNATSSTTSGAGSQTALTPNSPAEGLLLTVPTTRNYYARVTRTAGITGATADYLLSISKNGCDIGNGGCASPDVAITKTGPASAACGSTITYTLTASNTGSGPASNVLVTDDLPDCLTGVLVSATAGTFNVGPGNTVTGSIPTLAVGSPVTITITATVPMACSPTITNQARIDAAGDTNLANNTSSVVTTSVTTVATCSLSPATDTNPVNTSHTVTVTVTLCGVPVTGTTVNFAVAGRNTTSGSGTTNGSGQVDFTYTDTGSAVVGGSDTITATVVSGGSTCMATKDWVTAACVLTCPANVTQPNDSNQCGAVVTYPAPTPSGSCGTVNCSPASGSFFPVGTTTVTCTSQAGPTCSFTVTVTDTQAPAVTCPANITQPNTAGQCSAAVTYTTPVATDNCPGATVNCVPASGSSFPVGTTTVTCTATDAAANTGTCSFTITVQDTQAPAVTCPANMTVPKTTGQCSTTVNYTVPVATDNCPGATVSCVPSSGSTFPVGVTTVNCTASDASPNSPDTPCTFTITVTDTTAPVITCPANVTTPAAAGQCSAPVTYAAPTTSDNCPGVTLVCAPASGSTFPVGVTTVNCTATDASGNMGTCSFTITVQDTQVPVITCPANIVVTSTTTMGGCTFATEVIYPSPTAADNCGLVSLLCVPPPGSTFSEGTTTVVCTATDTSGNTAACTFTVTVGASFGFCSVDDATGDTFRMVVDPASPSYRVWRYTVVATGQTYCGRANSLNYVPGIRLLASDNDYSAENPTFFMNASFKGNSGTVTVRNVSGTIRLTLRDRNLADSFCP